MEGFLALYPDRDSDSACADWIRLRVYLEVDPHSDQVAGGGGVRTFREIIDGEINEK